MTYIRGLRALFEIWFSFHVDSSVPTQQPPPEARDINATAIHLYWDPPDNPNGLILSYRVYRDGNLIVEILAPSKYIIELHDDDVTWKCFLHYWPFVKGIHQSLVDSPHKGPVMQSSHIFFVVSLNKLLNKQPCYQWFEMKWHSCDITVMIRGQHYQLYNLLTNTF